MDDKKATVEQNFYYFSIRSYPVAYETSGIAMNLHIRHIEQNDVNAVSAVHYKAVRSVFANDSDKQAEETVNPEHFAAHWQNSLESVQYPVYVALEDNRVCGFVLFGPCLDKNAGPEDGEIYSLHADPDNRNDYLRLTLLETALSHLSFMGYRRFYIWAAEKDTLLTSLLTGYGFVGDGRCRHEKQNGLDVTTVHFVKTLYQYGEDGETIGFDDDDDVLRL